MLSWMRLNWGQLSFLADPQDGHRVALLRINQILISEGALFVWNSFRSVSPFQAHPLVAGTVARTTPGTSTSATSSSPGTRTRTTTSSPTGTSASPPSSQVGRHLGFMNAIWTLESLFLVVMCRRFLIRQRHITIYSLFGSPCIWCQIQDYPSFVLCVLLCSCCPPPGLWIYLD